MAVPGHHVDDAGRHALFQKQAAQQQRAARCQFARLDDGAATDGEREGQLLADDQQRIVPGRDEPHHAEGLAQQQAKLAAAQLVIGVAIGVPSQRGRIVPVGGCAPDLALGIGEGLADLEAFDPAEGLDLGLDPAGNVGQDSRPFGAAHAAPDAPVGSRAGRFRRQADILGRRARIAADRHLMRGIVPDELLALGRRDQTAADHRRKTLGGIRKGNRPVGGEGHHSVLDPCTM